MIWGAKSDPHEAGSQDKWCTLEWWNTQRLDIWAHCIQFRPWRMWKTKLIANEGKYDLTTKARRAVVGKNKQPDEGAGRQIWKCLDPLNCVALAAFWKHGTWVQIWTWHFRGKLYPAEPLTSVLKGIAGLDQLFLKSAWLVTPYHGVSRVSSAGFHWYDMQGKRYM